MNASERYEDYRNQLVRRATAGGSDWSEGIRNKIRFVESHLSRARMDEKKSDGENGILLANGQSCQGAFPKGMYHDGLETPSVLRDQRNYRISKVYAGVGSRLFENVPYLREMARKMETRQMTKKEYTKFSSLKLRVLGVPEEVRA
jgi:hypothetical protein